ncbi:DUF4249 domain-containing protein [Ulvibacterium marinum]|uniref:DUF4249 domain-containing protein n=1 Tax=Ulvibacterium marinum TaxID=2419782 RepID=UPI00249542C8|nr:DUF4249 domain-containing protein [Ulvibacterium marinum]
MRVILMNLTVFDYFQLKGTLAIAPIPILPYIEILEFSYMRLEHLKNRTLLFSIIAAVVCKSCIDPIAPDFELREDLIFIEGFASTEPGVSFVTISISAIEFGVYVVNFVEDASVNFENMDTGDIVPLQEIDEAYVTPDNFGVNPGESWKLNIQMPNGKEYTSEIEKVLEPIPLNNVRAVYDPELEFREIFGGTFVPGHEILVSFTDPPELGNYYYWTYRGYENLNLCEKCRESYFRDGECQPLPRNVGGLQPYYDYPCITDCWRIRFPESIPIFEDQFSNGLTITDFSIGNALLYTNEDIVIEVQQLVISSAAHEYYKVLKDLIDNNSGLNAPPPAGLIGNIFNPADSEEFVFGRFTAAATSVASVFVDRTFIREEALEGREPLITEPTFGSPLPPPATVLVPCSETRSRTAIRPEAWIDQ